MRKLPILKLIGEAMIIFVSVIGAFAVENYRESSNENEDYTETLLGFRNNIYKDILNFRINWDKTAPADPNFSKEETPIWIAIDSVLSVADSLLNDKSKTNDTIAFQLLINPNYFLMTDFRNETPYLSQLREFPKHLRGDTLEEMASLYSHHMRLEFTPAEAYNKTYYEFFLKLKEELDFNQIKGNDIQQNVNIKYAKNTIHVLKNQCNVAIMADRFSARRLSQFVISLDKVLATHKVDTSNLDKTWLLK